MIKLSESTILEDSSLIPSKKENLVEELLSRFEVLSQHSNGQTQIIESLNPTLTSSTSTVVDPFYAVDKWTNTFAASINSSYSETNTNFIKRFSTFNSQLDKYKKLFESRNGSLYILNTKAETINLIELVDKLIDTVNNIERVVNANNSGTSVIHIVNIIQNKIGEINQLSNRAGSGIVDVYKTHVDVPDAISNINLIKKLFIKCKELLKFMTKDYMYKAVYNEFIPTNSENGCKVLVVFNTFAKLLHSFILETINTVESCYSRFESDLHGLLTSELVESVEVRINPHTNDLTLKESIESFLSLNENAIIVSDISDDTDIDDFFELTMEQLDETTDYSSILDEFL